MTVEFKEFEKIARLNREVFVTEKIDGTNGSVHITEPTGTMEDYESVTTVYEEGGRRYLIRAGSRTGFIVPGRDNYGFAKWVADHAAELVLLGPGSHYGEWWGLGIQRKYNVPEKRFSLFNVGRWADATLNEPLSEKQSYAPRCCHVVPILRVGVGLAETVDSALADLRENGSRAAPGFMKPEGVVAFHTHALQLFKVTLERDQEPKSIRAVS